MHPESPTHQNFEPQAPGRRRRLLIATGLAGAVAIGAVAVPALATSGDATTLAGRRDTAVTGSDLGSTTLDELAQELAALDLELTVGPATAAALEEGTVEEGTADQGDPFAGMTDAEIDALSDEEFFALLDEAGWEDDSDWADEGDSPEGDSDTAGEGSFDETAATFTVDGDQLTVTQGTDSAVAEAQAIWGRFVELIPADQRSMIVGFELIAEQGGGGYVYPDETDPTKWILGISPGLGADLDFVLVHEFGHLLTLQAEEVPPGGDPDACSTYFTGEGCALSGSTFADFVARFWPQSMIDEIRQIEETGDWDAADAFYAKYADQFVTDYATTNPAEDLAETFTVFVLNDRPAGDSIADQKVQMLWDDPAMTGLRDQIRANR